MVSNRIIGLRVLVFGCEAGISSRGVWPMNFKHPRLFS